RQRGRIEKPSALSRTDAIDEAGGVAVVAATPSSQAGARGASPQIASTNCSVRGHFGDEASLTPSATGRRSHTAAPPESLRMTATDCGIVAATPSSQAGARGASPRVANTNCLVRGHFGDEASLTPSATGRRSHTAAAPPESLRMTATHYGKVPGD